MFFIVLSILFTLISMSIIVAIDKPAPMFEYNFKLVPIINEGYFYRFINFLEFLLILLIFTGLFYCVVSKSDISFGHLFVFLVITLVLLMCLHQLHCRAVYLLREDENYSRMSKLSSKELGDLWTETYKRKMLEINPNVFSEPKKTDFQTPLRILTLVVGFSIIVIIYARIWGFFDMPIN